MSRRRLIVALGIWVVGSILFLVSLQGCRETAEEMLPTVAAVAEMPGVLEPALDFVPTYTAVPVEAVEEEEVAETAVFIPPAQNENDPSPTAGHHSAQTAKEAPTATWAAYGVVQIIGSSSEGRPIEAYRFGFGTDVLVFVGGMHGGYEWNTILLAYEAIDYFAERPDAIPANITLYIIPAANPDGLHWATERNGRFTPEDVAEITIPARFNANEVDLNRNWDCEWQPVGNWNGREVSAGEQPFSEPETRALRNFFLRQDPEVVVFWHSKADGVYAGGCSDLYAPSYEIGETFAEAAGYNIHEKFNAYPITGDASDWLATQRIPSFTVELTVHDDTEWRQNWAGMLALLDHFSR